MPKGSKPDAENPAWTDAKFRNAKTFRELPADLQRALKRGRGPQRTPTKKLISIRLSGDVLAALRAKGPGWQGLADETLRKAFVKKAS